MKTCKINLTKKDVFKNFTEKNIFKNLYKEENKYWMEFFTKLIENLHVLHTVFKFRKATHIHKTHTYTYFIVTSDAENSGKQLIDYITAEGVCAILSWFIYDIVMSTIFFFGPYK